ncbi:hypothetical protein QWZ06_25920 [Chryseobacterium tructae]|uniref:hypothetical protein n=1 Tax=Chryseobacterium tructae TaxID=1037380 RepID=UPI0025B28DCE|nr:hypothetical protein [Chryseobacterium tructae]MDN3695418.1 hypothetical protein [Chryseobacterium tructae]
METEMELLPMQGEMVMVLKLPVTDLVMPSLVLSPILVPVEQVDLLTSTVLMASQ